MSTNDNTTPTTNDTTPTTDTTTTTTITTTYDTITPMTNNPTPSKPKPAETILISKKTLSICFANFTKAIFFRIKFFISLILGKHEEIRKDGTKIIDSVTLKTKSNDGSLLRKFLNEK